MRKSVFSACGFNGLPSWHLRNCLHFWNIIYTAVAIVYIRRFDLLFYPAEFRDPCDT